MAARRPWIPPSLAIGGAGGPLTLSVGDLGKLEAAETRWRPSFRIIASEYAGTNLFDRIADASEVDDLRAIADLTNPHALSELGQIELVPPGDRIYGAGAGLIMASFAWPGRPSRFSDGRRGTYYAARSEATSIRETVYHDEAFLRGSGPVVLEKTLIEADLSATLVDVRAARPAPSGLDHPSDYAAGQAFGAVIRQLGGDGILYHSVRHRARTGRALGECAAIFRPPVLNNAVAARTIEYRWDGTRIEVAG